MSGREGAVLHGRGCLYITLPVQGELFLNPKPRQQLAFLQGPGGSVLPCGMPRLHRCPVHLSAIFGTAEARLGASVGGEAPLQAVPFSPRLAGFLCQAVLPGALAPAKVTAGLGAAGGRALEIQRFLRHERLPKANNRGCRLLVLIAPRRRFLPALETVRGPTVLQEWLCLGHGLGLVLSVATLLRRHKHSLRAAYPQILVGKGAFP